MRRKDEEDFAMMVGARLLKEQLDNIRMEVATDGQGMEVKDVKFGKHDWRALASRV